MGSSSDQTIGYKYYLGLHMVLSYPVDRLLKFTVDDREAWSGSVSSGSITVDKPTLFGGKKKQGGVSGVIDILSGAVDQAVNSYLLSKLGSPISAFRGVFSVVHKDFYIGNSQYLKNFAYTVQRVDTLTTGDSQWYSAKSDISESLNPAHIIREALTSQAWGLGYPTATIDDTAFTEVADTLYTEGFGLSLLWNQSSTLEDFIRQVCSHIDAKCFVSNKTGLWTIKLLRKDYNVASIPSFDETNTVEMRGFSRIALGDTVNEINVVYRDIEDNKDKTVTVHNIGNAQMQGALVSQTIQYPGIPNAALANRVAQRDVIARSTPLAKLEAEFDRTAWDLSVGDVFKFSWAELGLVDVVFRVLETDHGTIEDPGIKVNCIEDVFGMPSSSFISPQPTGWSDPTSAPVDIPYRTLKEAPYWDIQRNISAADIATLQPDFGYVLTYAASPTGDSFFYDIYSKVGGASYVYTAEGDFAPTATLSAAIGLTDTAIAFDNPVDTDNVNAANHAYIGEEMVEIVSIDDVAGTATVVRGVLDTVPAAHAIGTRIWFSGGHHGIDDVERTDAQVIDVKLLPTTPQGTLDLGSATSEQITMQNRYELPYPPGNVKVNATAYPSTVQDTIDLTWAHRDRTQQLAYFNPQSEGNIGPETDVTYSLNIKDGGGSVIDSATGLTGTSHSFVPAFDADTVTVELWSVRDGLDSYQTHVFSFTYSADYTPSSDFTFYATGYTPSPNFDFDSPQ